MASTIGHGGRLRVHTLVQTALRGDFLGGGKVN